MIDRGVEASTAVLRRGVKVFAAPPGQPRARRATDVVMLVPAVLGLAIAIVAYPSAFERSLERFLRSIPSWLDPAWGFLSDSLWLWAVVLVVVALARRRLVVVGEALAALVLAALVGIACARLALGSWPDVGAALAGTRSSPRFPDVRVAEATAVLVAVSPHLVRPLRRFNRWLLLLGVAGAAVVGSGAPTGVLAAVLIGVVGAAVVNLALGTSAGRPGLDDVRAGLGQLGVGVRELEAVERQEAGVFHVRAVDERGRRLLVKVHGRDAADAQLVAKLWRSVWYRGDGPALGLGRLQSAEHEAFVTLLVRNAGLATREVVTAGATADDDALLVLRGDVEPVGSFPAGRVDDELLRGAWRALGLLDELKVAHQRIDPWSLVVTAGAVGFVDFGAATVAPDVHRLQSDRAQLLVTTATLAGEERAIRAASAALGEEGLTALLPYLQAAALSPRLRRALKEAKLDVDDLRERVADAVGVDPPALVRLRRVRSALQLGLLALASYAILSAAAGVDWSEVRSTVAGASWWWIGVAFLVAQLPRVTQTLSTLGSVPASLPFGPVYAMQLATGYMNVALPSNLARMAVNVRFFQRQGLSPPTAVAAGAIDSFASTVIQALLLLVLLVFTGSTIALDLPFPTGGERTLLWIVLGLAAASVLTMVAVGRVRRAIAERVRRWWPDVRAALGALRASHKLALLVLGSVATEVLFASALGLFAHSLGYDVSLAELLVINMSVSLLGSFVPVPGNIGVAEFGLAIGLTSAGMTEEAALAAVLLYRIATYYLPPLWGFVALQWLQRARYL